MLLRGPFETSLMVTCLYWSSSLLCSCTSYLISPWPGFSNYIQDANWTSVLFRTRQEGTQISNHLQNKKLHRIEKYHCPFGWLGYFGSKTSYFLWVRLRHRYHTEHHIEASHLKLKRYLASLKSCCFALLDLKVCILGHRIVYPFCLKAMVLIAWDPLISFQENAWFGFAQESAL